MLLTLLSGVADSDEGLLVGSGLNMQIQILLKLNSTVLTVFIDQRHNNVLISCFS